MIRTLKAAIRTLAMGILGAVLVPGQTVLKDVKKIADARKLFETLAANQSGCEVLPVKPHFIFSPRLQAGYVARVPLAESQGRKWIVLTAITPQDRNRDSVYLSDVVQLTNDGSEPEIEGFYWLGAGRYAVRFLMFDSHGDVCRKNWQIDARLNSTMSTMPPILAPGAVEGSPGTEQIRAAGAKAAGRLTILLHAASVLQMQTVLGKLDKAMLLDGMMALMEEVPASSVRLVVFNLEQRTVLLRKDAFTLDELPEVARVLDGVQPAAVDYNAVQNPRGTVDLIENLFNQEMRAAEPSGAIVFLGPKSMYRSKPSSRFTLPPGARQKFFYLVCEPTRILLPRSSTLSGGDWGSEGLAMGFPRSSPMGRTTVQPDLSDEPVRTNYGPNHGPDTIEYAVGQLKGKTLRVDSPESFADAAAAIVRLSGMNP